MRSHGMRDGANASCAAFRSSARTASVNTLTTRDEFVDLPYRVRLVLGRCLSASGFGAAAAADVDVSLADDGDDAVSSPALSLEQPDRTRPAATTGTDHAK